MAHRNRVLLEGMDVGEPSWSSDSNWIAFLGSKRERTPDGLQEDFFTEQIFIINIHNKEVLQLTEFLKHTSLGAGTSWSPDGRITFVMDGEVCLVGRLDRRVTRLTDLGRSSVYPYFPTWSPDGTKLAFIGRDSANQRGLYLFEPQWENSSSSLSKQRRTLLLGAETTEFSFHGS